MKKIRHNLQKWLCLFSLTLFTLTLKAEVMTFDFNQNCQNAYTHLISLRLDKGLELLDKERKINKNNATIYWLSNYADFLKTFILEEEKHLKQLDHNQDQRIKQLQKADKNSPYYLFSQAEIKLQTAFARLKFEQYMKAFWEIRKAYKMLEKNQRLFPDFIPNQKSLGLIHALVGTVPDQYQWGMKILGFGGSIEQGMKEVSTFLKYTKEKNSVLYQEALLMQTFLLIYLDTKKEQAWQQVQQISTKENLLNCMIVSNIAFRTGHSDYAIGILEKRPKGREYLDFYLLDYYLGTLKLNRLDADAAQYLERFVENFKGRHYIKDAYQKLAWAASVKGEKDDFKKMMQFAKTKGSKMVDADKQAHKAAQKAIPPHPTLLKARLLFDGGYYDQAVLVLKDKKETDFATNNEKLEYIYRRARIAEGQGKYPEAIERYEKSIARSATLVSTENDYFAPKACLQLGNIYEHQSNKSQAVTYYKKCLKYTDYEYKSSFDQQAKAGLNRLKS